MELKKISDHQQSSLGVLLDSSKKEVLQCVKSREILENKRRKTFPHGGTNMTRLWVTFLFVQHIFCSLAYYEIIHTSVRRQTEEFTRIYYGFWCRHDDKWHHIYESRKWETFWCEVLLWDFPLHGTVSTLAAIEIRERKCFLPNLMRLHLTWDRFKVFFFLYSFRISFNLILKLPFLTSACTSRANPAENWLSRKSPALKIRFLRSRDF